MGWDLHFAVADTGNRLKYNSRVDAPELIDCRWQGRQEWLFLMYEVPHEKLKDCYCKGVVDEHHSYCSDMPLIRPKCFDDFRALVKDKMPDNETAAAATDWLEQHEGVFVGGS